MEEIKAPHNLVYSKDDGLRFLVRQGDNQATALSLVFKAHQLFGKLKGEIKSNSITTVIRRV